MSYRMRTGILRMANVVVALAFLLGAGGVQAQVQLDPDLPTKAVGILDLDVPGFGTFDVVFEELITAFGVYGDFPGDGVRLAPFFDIGGADTAADAVNAELSAANILTIGNPTGEDGFAGYNIGVNAFILNIGDVDSITVGRSRGETGEWAWLEENFLTWIADEKPYAIFTSVPEPGADLLMVVALATLGVVARRRREVSEGTA